MYSIEIYKINLNTNKFDKIDIITDFRNLSYMQKLNGIGECSFDMEIQSEKAVLDNFIPYVSYVVVKKNKDIVWYGPISHLTGNYQDVSGSLSITAYTPLFHFTSRFTENSLVFRQIDQTVIAWNLINTVQSRTFGNLLISNNSSASGILRDREYQYGNITDLLLNLSNIINGFDFDFTPIIDSNFDLIGTNFNTYYPFKGTLRNDLPSLKIGENIQAFGFSLDNNFYNQLTVLGSGTGEAVTILSGNNTLSGGYNRIERIEKDSNIVLQSTLQTRANTSIQNNSIPKTNIEMEINSAVRPFLTEFQLGDSLFIDAKLKNNQIFKNYGRISQLSIAVDINGKETINPKFII